MKENVIILLIMGIFVLIVGFILKFIQNKEFKKEYRLADTLEKQLISSVYTFCNFLSSAIIFSGMLLSIYAIIFHIVKR